jgi:hypothetical protein
MRKNDSHHRSDGIKLLVAKRRNYLKFRSGALELFRIRSRSFFALPRSVRALLAVRSSPAQRNFVSASEGLKGRK